VTWHAFDGCRRARAGKGAGLSPSKLDDTSDPAGRVDPRQQESDRARQRHEEGQLIDVNPDTRQAI
jgi:hypothetical protein